MEHLIPSAWFQSQGQAMLLLVSAVCIALLIKGADLLVEGASGMAYRLGISKVIVGATIVALGTTSPEFGVSVVASWGGEPGLALGNAIGSIIADTGLIFGIGCLIAVLPADRFVLARQGRVQFASAALLAVICYALYAVAGPQATLGRGVGALFLILLVVYMYVSVQWSRRHRQGEPFQMDDEAERERKAHESARKLVVLGLVGLGLVLVASRVLVLSMTELAEVHWGVPKIVVAATIVALGTSLPELVIGMASIIKGQGEILVGNVIGADILNVLFVIGASAVAAPLPLLEQGSRVPAIALFLHIPTMLVVLVLFRLFIYRATKSGSFRRWYGVPLVAIYVIYTVVQFVVST